MNSNEGLQINQGADFHRTDVGNSQRLVLYHGDKIRYCSDIGAWYIWNGIRWERDEKGEIVQLAISVSEYMQQEAWHNHHGEQYTEHVKWAMQSEHRKRIEDMIALASTNHTTVVMASDLDSNPWLLNVSNGTLDLRTGDLGAHEPRDLITKLAPVAYDPEAKCPKWREFLDRILNDEELIAAFEQYVGVCLTGKQANVIFLCYGNGANGKTTFLETILAMLGDYAQKAPSAMLEAKQYTAIPNDIARLRGARFVVSNELNAHRRLDEALVKDLTGGDTITARYLRKEFFEFAPTHKLWVQGNHLPLIEGTDEGIWRRIRLIPFKVVIPEEERNANLRAELREELSGILTWAIQGLRKALDGGSKIVIPEMVKKATDEYRRDLDAFGQFLTDKCEIGDGHEVYGDELYLAYADWCQSNGEQKPSQRTLGMMMKARGFEQRRTSKKRRWIGIRIK